MKYIHSYLSKFTRMPAWKEGDAGLTLGVLGRKWRSEESQPLAYPRLL